MGRYNKRKLTVIGFLVFILIYLFFVKSSIDVVDNSSARDGSENVFEDYDQIEKINSDEIHTKGNEKKRFLFADSSMHHEGSQVFQCQVDKTIEIETIDNKQRADVIVSKSSMLKQRLHKNQYTMVYEVESEVHSPSGHWSNADFKMYYNLDESFPEPATYFNVRTYLANLLAHPTVDFENKNFKPIVWVVSNCHAHNGRQIFMQELMDKIKVDSAGACLKNVLFDHPSQHYQGNLELFEQYKFVISIENSNCIDYVTEKLDFAVMSGAVPIVASIENKPDYTRFLPRNSYINVLDYKSIDDLVRKLNSIANSRTEYEEYMAFKFRHNYSRDYLHSLNLTDLIELARSIIGPDEPFFRHLIAKETSDNKLCKIASYLNKHTPDQIRADINKHKGDKKSAATNCMKGNLLPEFFGIHDKN